MNKVHFIIGSIVAVAALAFTINAQPAKATSADCTVAAVGKTNTTGQNDSRFVRNADGSVSTTFEVKGPQGCTQPVVIAAWEAPDAIKGQPYDQQKLVASKNGTYSVGTHTLTIALPDCYYQIDLARGLTSTGPNGSPVYEAGRLMGSLHGGTKKCETTPETPITPVTPVTPEAPATPAAPVAEMPTELPVTGGASTTLILMVVAAALAAGTQYVRQARHTS